MTDILTDFELLTPPAALKLVRILEDAGHESWMVGGFVRDVLMGRGAHDVDIATHAPAAETMHILEEAGIRVIPTGLKHGTVSALLDDDIFEITTYRTESTYSDNRHPDTVKFVEHIEQDLARRDFTMNAIAYHPTRGIFDPFEGQKDIKRGIIRAMGEANARFTEDALRIMRVLRFSAELGFIIDPLTRAALFSKQVHLRNVSVERITQEFTKLLCGTYAPRVLVEYVDVLSQVIPELLCMKDLDQRTKYHIYDVLKHTSEVVAHSPATPRARWSALFHDIGKPESYFTDEDGVGHFYGHPAVSESIARETMQRLRFARTDAEHIALLVRYHDSAVEPTEQSIKRMVRKLGGSYELFYDLCAIKVADASSQAPRCAPRIEEARKLAALAHEIERKHPPLTIASLPIDGHELQSLGIPASRIMGDILQEALDAVIDGNLRAEHDELADFCVARYHEMLLSDDEHTESAD